MRVGAEMILARSAVLFTSSKTQRSWTLTVILHPLLVSSIPQGPHLRLGLLARLHELPPPRSQLVGDEHVELVVAKNESLHRNLFNFFV